MRNSNFNIRVMRVVYISVAVFGVAIGAIAGDVVSPANEHTIDIRNFSYEPDPITVSLGDTIIWTNHDIVPHTATLVKNDVGTGEISVSESRSMIMQERGELQYVCRYHPNMRGVIDVR